MPAVIALSAIPSTRIETRIQVKFLRNVLDDDSLIPRKYTVYSVTFDDGAETFETERRYSDFDQLWRTLQNIYVAQVIPPLPVKKLIGRMDGELISKRARDLGRALNSALRHPILSEDEYLRTFITFPAFASKFPLIKNVDPPLIIPSEWFSPSRWTVRTSNNMPLLSNESSFHQGIEKKVNLCMKLRRKLRSLQPLLERVVEERRELKGFSGDCVDALKSLLNLNKSSQIFAEDAERPLNYLKTTFQRESYSDSLGDLKFIVKYIDALEVPMKRWKQFCQYKCERDMESRELESKLSNGLDNDEVFKIPFDHFYDLKVKLSKALDGGKEINVKYADYSRLLDEELYRLINWLREDLKAVLIAFFSE